MINIENLSKKQIAFGKNDDELQKLMYLNKLPYMYPEIKNTLPRPANLPLYFIPDEKIIYTHSMSNEQIVITKNNLENAVKMQGADYVVFQLSPHVAFTYGDLLTMLNDECLFRAYEINPNEIQH